MSKHFEEYDQNDFDDEPKRRMRQRSPEYDRKKRRAEAYLEKRRLQNMLGFDVDYPDYG